MIAPGLASMNPPGNSAQKKMEDHTSQQYTNHIKYYKPLGCWNKDPLSLYGYHVNFLNTDNLHELQPKNYDGGSSYIDWGRKKPQIEFDLKHSTVAFHSPKYYTAISHHYFKSFLYIFITLFFPLR